MRLEIPRFCWGSVRAGEEIGQAVFAVNGTVAATIPIIAESDVTAIVYEKTVWDKIGDFFAAIRNWLAGLFA